MKNINVAGLVAVFVAGTISLSACGGSSPSSSQQDQKPTVVTNATQGETGKPSRAPYVPVAVQQPPTAEDVATALHCGKFKDLGAGELYVTDSGSCYIGGKKYAIAAFVSTESRDSWLNLAEEYGVVPKWETATSVTYPSVD